MKNLFTEYGKTVLVIVITVVILIALRKTFATEGSPMYDMLQQFLNTVM